MDSHRNGQLYGPLVCIKHEMGKWADVWSMKVDQPVSAAQCMTQGNSFTLLSPTGRMR